LNAEPVSGLAAQLRGKVISPTDAGYEEARKVWNGTIEKKPGLIVRCATVEDVIAAVNFARGQGLAVSVRGGGHHVAGGALNDDGLVIDLSELRGVSYDASTQTARAEGGAQLQDVDTATLAHGRAVPMGVFSETGIAGLTLGGGYGWQSASRGLTCDNLVAADVVTADGRLLKASESENPDLFWALRGGGTNLGVVTLFEYRTHPVPENLFICFVTYPLAQGKQVFDGLREFKKTSPREVGIISVIWTFPASEPYPEEVWNQQFVAVLGSYMGPAEAGERILQPLRQLATPLLDMSEVSTFATLQRLFDEEYPKGRRYYWRSSYLSDLSDEAIEKLVDLGARRPSPLSSLDLWVLGGAIAEVALADTPIVHRDAPYMVGIEANWDDPGQDAANIAWARGVFTTLAPYSTGGSYLNFEDSNDQDRVAAVYGANYQRLMEIKRKYDPDNLFGSRRG